MTNKTSTPINECTLGTFRKLTEGMPDDTLFFGNDGQGDGPFNPFRQRAVEIVGEERLRHLIGRCLWPHQKEIKDLAEGEPSAVVLQLDCF